MAKKAPKAALRLRQILRSPRSPQALLLVGPTAAPLNALATIAAYALLCQSPPTSFVDGDACGLCDACKLLAKDNHPDLVRLCASERGLIDVGRVRSLDARLSLMPRGVKGRHVVIIDRACQMLPAAQNALLKVLEEPPSATTFVLMAERMGQILPTLRSRVSRLPVSPQPLASAHKDLVDGGVPEALAALLAPWLGADQAAVQHMLDLGAQEVVDTLLACLRPNAQVPALFAAATDVAQTPERLKMAQIFIEIWVRHALAEKNGATQDHLSNARKTPVLKDFAVAQLTNTVDLLHRQRALGHIPLSRPMLAEGLLLTLCGHMRNHAHANAFL